MFFQVSKSLGQTFVLVFLGAIRVSWQYLEEHPQEGGHDVMPSPRRGGNIRQLLTHPERHKGKHLVQKARRSKIQKGIPEVRHFTFVSFRLKTAPAL